MISHLRHQVVVVEEQEADHGDDEESSTSGLQESKETADQINQNRFNYPLTIRTLHPGCRTTFGPQGIWQLNETTSCIFYQISYKHSEFY